MHVFTRIVKRTSDQDADFISSDIAGFVRKLARLKGKDIWLVEGAEIVSILLNAGLVDRIILSVHSTVKQGHILVQGYREVEMELTRSIFYESGLVKLHYEL